MDTILVGFDGSPNATRALDFAIAIARPLGARVRAVYAVAPMHARIEAAGAGTAEAQAAQIAYGNDLIRTARAVRPDAPLDGEVRVGYAAETLAHAADHGDVRMVVTGTRGRGGIASLVLGSCSHDLIRLSRKPVVVVP